MKEKVDPKLYGLHPRTVLMQESPNEFTLVINRKSRIIIKDAKAILKKADKIKEKVPAASVSLETIAPVCSKTIKLLEGNGIRILISKI